MALSPGTRIGAYEVVSAIGAGGMGEVYRARDPHLNRDVAIKVLPAAFARDPERVARFRREAQALAALNDAHIAQIYQLEEIPPAGAGQAGITALVMECVEGRTLAEIVAAGTAASHPIELDEAIRLGAEMAAGLETAHERGIVHRDLKPANVKITPDGHVKILDFGLAKAMSPGPDDVHAHTLANSPTLTARATEAGMILGTAAYMSPEQARGKTVDKRTDIWAFGAVLFEMLTGRRAFDGDTVSDTLASVLRSGVDWAQLPAGTPPHVRALLARCLERDQSRRLRDIGEARLALAAGSTPPNAGVTNAPASTSSTIAPAPARPWIWMAATVVCAAIAVAAIVWPRRAPAQVSAFDLALAPPPDTTFEIGPNSGNVIVSPDGTAIAFVASSAKGDLIWIRPLASAEAKPLAGTDDPSYPFWSPDGKRIGFFSNGKLKTIVIAGGLPEVIADAPSARGGSWSEDDTIVFTPVGGGTICRVSAHGGAVTPLTKLDLSRGESAHYWPVFLPGGTQYLYFARSGVTDNSGIYLARLDGSIPAVRIVPSLSAGIPVIRPSMGGLYLIWAREHDLLAQPVDAGRAALTGEAVTIGHDVRVEESQRLAFVGASRTGLLAWASARAALIGFGLYARDGHRIRTLDVVPGVVSQPGLSPDDQQLLYTRIDKGLADIFRYDMRTNVSERLTTGPGYREGAVWSPDGKAFVYLANERGEQLLRRLSFGVAAPSVVVHRGNTLNSGIDTPGSRFTLLSESTSQGGTNMLAQPADGGTPVTLSTSPDVAFFVSITTDGRWVLVQRGNVVSVDRVHTELSPPSLGASIVLGTGVGLGIRADGREAYFSTPGGVKVVALNLAADTGSIGSVTLLFPATTLNAFAANSKGTEFVLGEAPFSAGQTLTVLTNWEARLK
jgi:Tol biopolymer transport system component/tRNA A-37 threonylcarbamoyl transferase component Bud32